MNRLDLHNKFLTICPNVYFQPPASMKLKYPCIIYERRSGDTTFADDITYRFVPSYTVTYIDSNPDSTVPDKLVEFTMCKQNRCYTSDNLNHTVFIIYY